MIELLGLEIGQQSIVIGIIAGLTYAALAAGFVLIYRSTGVLNFAHGEMGFFGLAIFVMMIINYELNWWVAFVLAIAGTALIGMAVELIVVRRLLSSDSVDRLPSPLNAPSVSSAMRLLERLRVRSPPSPANAPAASSMMGL